MDCRVRSLTRLRSNAVLESALHSDGRMQAKRSAEKLRLQRLDLGRGISTSSSIRVRPSRGVQSRAELLRRGTLGKIRVRLQRRRGWNPCWRGRL